MIVCHSFFCKSGYPKHLASAIGLMLMANNSAFVRRRDFDEFVADVRTRLHEDTGGRYDKGELGLSVNKGQIQIEVKCGLDYAARLDYISVEKVFEWNQGTEKFDSKTIKE